MKTLIRRAVQAMEGYVPGEQPPVADLIKLNTNENPYPPSPKVFRAIREFDAVRLRLYPDPVSRDLRARVAHMHRCRREQVFAGNGSDEILALCTRAFAEDSGSIGYFHPSYSLYPVLADIRVVRKKPVELGPKFEWRMPAGYRCSLFLMTCPNAPTGVQYPRRLVEGFCRRMPGVVLIDEAYVDFARENFMDLALKMPNVLVMRTLSKSFSLAGLRLGYVVGAKPLIAALFKIKDSYNVDMLCQKIGLAALSDPGHMRRNVARIRASRERLARALADLGFDVTPSEANFLWVRPEALSAAAYCRGLRKRKILVRCFPGPRTGRHVRITIGTDSEVDALLSASAELLRGKEGGR